MSLSLFILLFNANNLIRQKSYVLLAKSPIPASERPVLPGLGLPRQAACRYTFAHIRPFNTLFYIDPAKSSNGHYFFGFFLIPFLYKC